MSKSIQQCLWLIVFVLTTISTSWAQRSEDSDPTNKPKIKFRGFIDSYYGYDFKQPANNLRPDFLFNHTRHNEFNINLALLELSVEGERYRANLGLMAGTYAQYNLAHEEELLRNIFQANVGIALDAQRKLWFDMGIFPSHLGFESAISTENFTLTRSLVAENSPYYLAGGKLTWQPDAAWTFTTTVANGWQRIRRVPGNSLVSVGTSVTYTPSESTTLNWSTFIGTEDPDNTRRMMYFNNLYGIFNLSEQFALIAGFDFGLQQAEPESSEMDNWLAPVLIARYNFNENWAIAARAEYYDDPSEVIISAFDSPNGFRTTGFSLNVDRRIHEKAWFRLEGRWFNSPDNVFADTDGSGTSSNLLLIGSLALDLDFMPHSK